MASKSKTLLRAKDIRRMRESSPPHPLNPNAVRNSRSLGDATGLKNLGVHLARVEPGHETTEFHFHHNEDEFMYILSGRGVAELGDGTFEVGPGDFMGLPAGGPPHTMSNPFDEDFVYLLGGQRAAMDVCDYPRQQRRRYRTSGVNEYVDWKDIRTGTAAQGSVPRKRSKSRS